ncbi:MAG: hypothetical protein WC897_00255 [Candidatus Gracilibacteria bacterium]
MLTTETLKPEISAIKPDRLPALRRKTRERMNEPVNLASSRTGRMLTAIEAIPNLESMDADGLEKSVALYFEKARFVDKGLTPEKIEAVVRYATGEGIDAEDREISPIPSDITERMDALEAFEASGEEAYVATVNIGGSNTTANLTTVKDGKITLKNSQNLSFRNEKEREGTPIQCIDHLDFWRRVIPSDFLQALKELTTDDLNNMAIEFAIPFPIKDGHVIHCSDKVACNKNPLGPLNDREARKGEGTYPNITQSVLEFLRTEGINLISDKTHTGDNDTINGALGMYQEASRILDEKGAVGFVICGTGFNIAIFKKVANADGTYSIKGYNLEMGHFRPEEPCALDVDVNAQAKTVDDIESCVSGKNLGNVFKMALTELTNPNSGLRKFIDNLSKDDANEMIFRFGIDETPLEGQQFNALTENEKTLLKIVCKQFVERVIIYFLAVFQGISASTGHDAVFLKEGSVFDKNPKLVAEINRRAGRGIISMATPKTEGMTPSSSGAVFDALAKSKIAEGAN